MPCIQRGSGVFEDYLEMDTYERHCLLGVTFWNARFWSTESIKT